MFFCFNNSILSSFHLLLLFTCFFYISNQAFSHSLYLSLYFTSSPGFSSHPSFSPPPSFQVKRFLPRFPPNWRMRCMSWLHCCFIRKRLFVRSLPPPLLFFFPCSHSTLSSFLHISFSPLSYLACSTFLLNVNWWKYVVNEEFSHLRGHLLFPLKWEGGHMDNDTKSLNKLGRCEKWSIITSVVSWSWCIVRLFLTILYIRGYLRKSGDHAAWCYKTCCLHHPLCLPAFSHPASCKWDRGEEI